MSLILHSGAWGSSRQEVNSIPVPEATSTYYPVSHREVIESVSSKLIGAGYVITREELALNKSGKLLFGVMELNHIEDNRQWCIGLRNSYNKQLALGLVGGIRVTVCDNLLFSGELAYQHKHTKGLSLEEGLSTVIDTMGDTLEQLTGRLEDLTHDRMSEGEASIYTIDLVRKGLIASKHITPIMDEFISPSFDSFLPYVDTTYNWLMAVTHIAKAYSAARQAELYSDLGSLLKL